MPLPGKRAAWLLLGGLAFLFPLASSPEAQARTALGRVHHASPSRGKTGRKQGKKDGKAQHHPLLQGGELLLFQEIPQVVTAGRCASSRPLSPAPVSMITSREISASGLTFLPDILTFIPGMDVSKVDRLRYAVGVRGLHSFWSDHTLALIDGRNATHPAFGGTFYQFLPVMAEDIERIEVVRGPIGAAWGANAFNGAVNILTKKPADVQGLTARGKINQFGDHRLFFRWGAEAGELSWRISSAFRSVESSSDALVGEDFDSNDSCKELQFDAACAWKLGEGDTLSFGAAHAWNRTGDFEHIGFWPRKHGRVEITRIYAKHDHEFPSGSKGYVQFFCNREKDYFPSEGRPLTVEYDLEAQMEGEWLEGHDFSVGGNLRLLSGNYRNGDPQEIRLPGHQIFENWAGVFCSDTWSFARKTTMDIQGRVDRYSETGVDWSGRLSLLRELAGEERHVLRVSLAHSFRAPLMAFRKMSLSRVPLGGGAYGYNVDPNNRLDNEEIYSIEEGYSGNLGGGFSLNVNTYYQFLGDLISLRALSATRFQMVNDGRARAFGGEIEADWRAGPVQAGAWYGYNRFRSLQAGKQYRVFRPALHQAGAKVLARLPARFQVSCLYKYSTAIHTPGTPSVPVVNRVDLTLSKTFLRGEATLQVGVSDIFRHSEKPVYELMSFTAHRTPGRTFFASLILSF